jgi:ferrochelatase
MAYGAPSSESEIEAYLTDIRGGRKPGIEAVAALKERYRKIGGRSPLLEITRAQAAALERTLSSRGTIARVYVGMRHWHPYIGEVVAGILSDGFLRIVGLPLAPYYSSLVTGSYRRALEKAVEGLGQVQVDFVESWCDNPLFHQALSEKIRDSLREFPQSSKVQVIFTAHSLPCRVIEQDDPYPKQIQSSCETVAKLSKIDRWSFAYQSAGKTDEKWLGPDVLEALNEWSLKGDTGHVLIVPLGFVADNLEILYDIDLEARLFARARGLDLKRTESLNASPTFINGLADILHEQLS